jgi:hypothetical protein
MINGRSEGLVGNKQIVFEMIIDFEIYVQKISGGMWDELLFCKEEGDGHTIVLYGYSFGKGGCYKR